MKRLLGRKKKMKKKGDGMMISMTPPGVLIQGKRYRSLSLYEYPSILTKRQAHSNDDNENKCVYDQNE